MLRRIAFFILFIGPSICYGHDLLEEQECDSFLEANYNERSEGSSCIQKGFFYPNFSDNPLLTNKMKDRMQPWLLPHSHKMKAVLDQIFTSPAVINSEKSLRKAGFKILFSQKKSFIRVIKHKKLPGYLIKLFPNNEKLLLSTGWKRLTIRCIVAQKIKSIISRHHIKHFIVADKWLYPMPYRENSIHTQPVVLLVKNMKIYNRHDTKIVWKKANKKIVSELYKILGRGYGSAFLSGNLPYTKYGKFAFIDTEFEKRKIHLGHARRFLSRRMQHHWDSLVKHHRL